MYLIIPFCMFQRWVLHTLSRSSVFNNTQNQSPEGYTQSGAYINGAGMAFKPTRLANCRKFRFAFHAAVIFPGIFSPPKVVVFSPLHFHKRNREQWTARKHLQLAWTRSQTIGTQITLSVQIKESQSPPISCIQFKTGHSCANLFEAGAINMQLSRPLLAQGIRMQMQCNGCENSGALAGRKSSKWDPTLHVCACL